MINKAMILAAGLGLRMRPITEKTPKPLVRINGKALIDHKLDALERAGIETVIVNVHYLADQVESHLRFRKTLKIIISDERKQLMDSGGGIFRALPNFGDDVFVVVNSDAFWFPDEPPGLSLLLECWDEKRMDILMALTKTDSAIGFHDKGDFFMDDVGLLARRKDRDYAPYAFSGDYIVHPRIFNNLPDGPFSANTLFDRAIEKGQLTGIEMEGLWLHVGTPQSINDAEKAIALYQSDSLEQGE